MPLLTPSLSHVGTFPTYRLDVELPLYCSIIHPHPSSRYFIYSYLFYSHSRSASALMPFQFLGPASEAMDFSFLPTHFDTPDITGWAGCTAQEAGQPEAIRINLNEVLGHGANGTMVFACVFPPFITTSQAY